MNYVRYSNAVRSKYVLSGLFKKKEKKESSKRDTWIKTNYIGETTKLCDEATFRYRKDKKNNNFWAEKIKELYDEPDARLAKAVDNLPLPAAFREAAIALRALIRANKKESKEYIDQLTLLYWMCAVDSFSLPRSDYLRLPGYNVMELVPGEVIKQLPFSYKELGYKELKLLNKTDVKVVSGSLGRARKSYYYKQNA